MLLAALLFLLTVNNLMGQSNQEIGKPFINNFSPKDYKSGPLNWCVLQDNRGVMYFGNESGVLEYDGLYWRKIEVPGNQTVRSLAMDKNGTIYVCAGIDFGYLAIDSTGEEKFKSLLPFIDEKYRNFAEVWDVVTSSSGVFFKTDNAIFRWNGKNITVWDSVSALRLYTIDGTVYSRNRRIGLMQIEGDSLKIISDGGFFSSIGVYDMLPFKRNSTGKIESILITTNADGLLVQTDNKFAPFKTEADSFLKNNQIYNAAVTSNGNFVFATQRGGVVIIDNKGKLIKIIDEASGLTTNVIYDVYPDRNGGLWLATGDGISYCNEKSSLSIFKNYGKLKNRSNAVIRHNGILYASNDLGVLYLKNKNLGFQLAKESNKSAYAFLDENGNLFAATNYGLASFDNFTLKNYLMEDPSTFLLNSDAFPDRFYTVANYGFAVIHKQKNSSYKIAYQKNTNFEATSIVEEKEGSFWVGGDRGLIHATGKISELAVGVDKNIKFEFYDEKNGLPGSIRIANEVNKKLLLATDKGVYSFDANSKTFIHDNTLGKTLSDSTTFVWLIRKGENGKLWIVAEIQGKYSLGQSIPKNNGTYEWKPMPEFSILNLESVTSMYSDIDPDSGLEKLWISTDEGLVLFNTAVKDNVQSVYSALIRKVIVNNDSVVFAGHEPSGSAKKELILAFSNNNISFEFSAPCYDKPNSTLFQCFLEGEDAEWTKWSPDTKKEYTNLPQGSYIFHVRAENIYGVISNESVFRFKVLAPWYFTWWAFFLYFLITGGFLFSIRKFELNRREKNNQLKISQLRTETAEFQAKVAETQAKLIQADNDRKTEELEEARELQLSLLPKVLPDLPNIEIAFYMKTATEVGGDYYDFNIESDGTLTVAVGDATGHGMKAGTVVSMVKALFSSGSSRLDIKSFFDQSSNALKSIELGRLMMAFIMLKISPDKMQFANAGMPPLFIYRKKLNEVEELILNGMPLGAMKNFPYQTEETEIFPGDVILVLSDGLPELKNEKDEEFGYVKVKAEFLSAAEKTPDDIADHLTNSASNWSIGTEPDDDVTFVVIKIK